MNGCTRFGRTVLRALLPLQRALHCIPLQFSSSPFFSSLRSPHLLSPLPSLLPSSAPPPSLPLICPLRSSPSPLTPPLPGRPRSGPALASLQQSLHCGEASRQHARAGHGTCCARSSVCHPLPSMPCREGLRRLKTPLPPCRARQPARSPVSEGHRVPWRDALSPASLTVGPR